MNNEPKLSEEHKQFLKAGYPESRWQEIQAKRRQKIKLPIRKSKGN